MNSAPNRSEPGDEMDCANARRLLPAGEFLEDIVAMALRQNPSLFTRAATVEVGVKRCLTHLTSEGRIRQNTLKQYRQLGRQIVAAFGSRRAAEADLKSDEVIAWVQAPNLVTNRIRSISRQSALIKFFRRALKTIGLTSPLCDPRLRMRLPVPGESHIFTVDEITTLFSVSPRDDWGFLAAVIFCGLRPSCAEKLTPSDINQQSRTITIPGPVQKVGGRKVLEGYRLGVDGRRMIGEIPDIFWEWIKLYPFAPRRWVNIQRRLRRKLGMHWLRNGLRRSGSTYCERLVGGEATSRLLTHASGRLLKTYVSPSARIRDAIRFARLKPHLIPPMPKRQRRISPIFWPDDAQLASMVQEKSVRQVAREIGCWPATVEVRCRSRKIPLRVKPMPTAQLVEI